MDISNATQLRMVGSLNVGKITIPKDELRESAIEDAKKQKKLMKKHTHRELVYDYIMEKFNLSEEDLK